MENFGEQILIPEPATRFSSLLKPTLLAQSQQKEVGLYLFISYLWGGVGHDIFGILLFLTLKFLFRVGFGEKFLHTKN